MKDRVATVLAYAIAWATVIVPLGGLSLWLDDRALARMDAVEQRMVAMEGRLKEQAVAVEGRLKEQVKEVRENVTALSFRLSGVASDAAYIKGYLRMTQAPGKPKTEQ